MCEFVVCIYFVNDVVVVDEFVVDVKLWDGWLFCVVFDGFVNGIVLEYVEVVEFGVVFFEYVDYGF